MVAPELLTGSELNVNANSELNVNIEVNMNENENEKDRDNNRDYRGPKHPKEVHDYAKCAKWEEQFINYCLSRSAMRTLRKGEAGSYPSFVEELTISTTTAEKNKGNKLKLKADKAANGRRFGWLCQATELTAPSLYRKIRHNEDIFDGLDEKKEEG